MASDAFRAWEDRSTVIVSESDDDGSCIDSSLIKNANIIPSSSENSLSQQSQDKLGNDDSFVIRPSKKKNVLRILVDSDSAEDSEDSTDRDEDSKDSANRDENSEDSADRDEDSEDSADRDEDSEDSANTDEDSEDSADSADNCKISDDYANRGNSSRKKCEFTNEDDSSTLSFSDEENQVSFKIGEKNDLDNSGSTSTETEGNEDSVKVSHQPDSRDEKFCKDENLQNPSLSISAIEEDKPLSQYKSCNENIYSNDDPKIYFDEGPQLAILESLNNDSEKVPKEQTELASIQMPLNEQSMNNILMQPVQVLKREHEGSVKGASLSDFIEHDHCSVDDDGGENKENLLAEKIRLDDEIRMVSDEIKNIKGTLRTANIDVLPDKGMRLKVSLDRKQSHLDTLKEQIHRVNSLLDSDFKNLITKKDLLKENLPAFSSLPSANLQDMGEKARETHRVEQALTVDALRNLHSSLNTCPPDDQLIHDPDGLKIPLMVHQKQALAWMMWRESVKPSGGILADDMGLGKTLTMISFILTKNEKSEDDSDNDDDYDFSTRRHNYKGGTLVVCPPSLIGQWESEIKQRVKRGLLTFEMHHGPKREKKARRLAKPDIVITTYPTVLSEYQNYSGHNDNLKEALFSVKWKRIILDEAHVIRNHKSKTANAIFSLRATYRWALTGTPVHNKTQDFYSLVKFLRCKPFNDLSIWKKWVEAKDLTGSKRLNTLTKTLMLRRTKDILISEGKLESLPDKSSEIITVRLGEDELALYEEVSNISKSLLTRLLAQRAEKDQLLSHGIQFNRKKVILPENENPFNNHPELNEMFKRIVNMEDVKTHAVLVLLLRLRQICCHPALMKSMIEKEAVTLDGIEDEDGTDEDLLEKMSGLKVNDNDGDCEHNDNIRKEAARRNNVFNPNNDIFKPEWMSSKIKAVLKLLEENLLKTDDKVVIVSQWTSMLDLIYDFLKHYKHCKCERLTGKVPVDQRMNIVSEFNRSSSTIKVLLLSLTAGGTGLNLVGGNHLILTDLHWNPQLEAQACDRIYRMGQKKPVKIYKFVCAETVEETIQKLQNDKLAVADSVLSGARQLQVAKLSLNDLKMLFNIK